MPCWRGGPIGNKNLFLVQTNEDDKKTWPKSSRNHHRIYWNEKRAQLCVLKNKWNWENQRSRRELIFAHTGNLHSADLQHSESNHHWLNAIQLGRFQASILWVTPPQNLELVACSLFSMACECENKICAIVEKNIGGIFSSGLPWAHFVGINMSYKDERNILETS